MNIYIRIFGWTGRRRGWCTNTRRKIGEGGGCLLEVKDCIFCCRYIFWNAGGLGWSIGKLEYLEDGRHWHKSRFIFRKIPPWTIIRLFSGGSDAKEPWQDVWLSGVTVKCSSNRQQKSKSGQMPN